MHGVPKSKRQSVAPRARSAACLACAIVAVLLAIVGVAGCGGDGGDAFIGSWQADDGTPLGIRVVSAGEGYLVSFIDLSRLVDDSVVFTTAAEMQDVGETMKLATEPEGDGVAEGGILTLEGERLVYTDHLGATHSFTSVEALTPTGAPEP